MVLGTDKGIHDKVQNRIASVFLVVHNGFKERIIMNDAKLLIRLVKRYCQHLKEFMSEKKEELRFANDYTSNEIERDIDDKVNEANKVLAKFDEILEKHS